MYTTYLSVDWRFCTSASLKKIIIIIILAKAPGDFGLGYPSTGGAVAKLEGDKKVEKLTKELQNGRLAMLAIMELLTHDVAKPVGESVLTLHHF